MFFAIIPLLLLALALSPRIMHEIRRGLLPTLGSTDKEPDVAPQSRLFRLANKLGGVLTVSDVVIELGLGTEEAERMLDGLVDGHRVRIDVSDEGFTRYEFAEITRRSKIEDAG